MARQQTYYNEDVTRNITVSGSGDPYEFGLDNADQILLSVQDEFDFTLNTYIL